MTDDRTLPEGAPTRRPVLVPPAGAGATAGAVHEEERVGVLPDGSVVREFDRVEEPPLEPPDDGGRNWWPWAV